MRTSYKALLLSSIVLLTLIARQTNSQQLDTLKIKADADSLCLHGESLRKAFQLEEALEILKVAQRKYNQIGDLENEARTLLSEIGYVYYLQSKQHKLLEVLQDALVIYEELGDSLRIARTMGNMANVYMDLSEFTKAMDCFEKIIPIFRQLGNRKDEALLMNQIGKLHQHRSDYNNALKYYQKSLNIGKEAGIREREGYAYFAIGLVYWYLYDYYTAIKYYERSMQIQDEIGNIREVSKALGNLGTVYKDLGDYSKALDYYRQALDACKHAGDRRVEGNTLLNIGGVYESLNEYNKASEHYQRSLELFKQLDQQRDIGVTYCSIGWLECKKGDFEKAESAIQKAISIAQNQERENDLQKYLFILGRVYSMRGLNAKAIHHFSTSIEIAEKVRGKLGFEMEKRTYSAGISEIYEEIVQILLNSNRNEDAFNYTERARARSFLDLLASGEITVGKSKHAEFLQKEGELYREENALEKRITKAGEDTVQISLFRGKVDELRGSREKLIEGKKLYEPELASLVTVNALTLPEVQEMLHPKVTLIEYFLTEEKTLIWLVTRDHADVIQVDIGGDSLKTLVEGFRAAIKGTGAVDKRSKGLYDLLIEPIVNEIKTKNLIIVPHGILHYLPFQALQNRKGKYLIEKYKISYLPSASVMKYLEPKRRQKGERLLAFGNPMTDRQGYGPIPQSEQEVWDLAELYENREILTGEDARESKFRELAPNYDILHLACHGELNSAYPLFSGLLLTPGEDQDGELDVHELFTLDLNAYLVVLSACETGLGHLTTGDELVGLSRAFIYAGTPSVISSLWQVEDESTAYLMKQFYMNLRKYNKVDALRRAQLKTKKKYDDVASWASFVLIGDVN